jgi:hypothetical protein
MNIFERNTKKTLFFCVVLLLLIIEGGLKLYSSSFGELINEMYIDPPEQPIEDKLVHHLGTKKPNTRFIRKPGPNDRFEEAENVINSQGLRGDEINPKSQYRILFVGDSFIEADEIKFENIFSERLNKFYAGKYEFISHGVSSWSPTTEFSWIYHYGLKLQPDEVFVFICWNDFYPSETYSRSDDAYSKVAIFSKEGIPVEYVGRKESEKINHPIYFKIKNSFIEIIKKIEIGKILYFGINSFTNYLSPPLTEQAPIFLFSKNYQKWPATLQKSVNQTVDVIFKLNTYLSNQNIKLTVVLIPNPFQWKDEIMAVKKNSQPWQSLIDGAGSSPEDFSLSETGLNTYLTSRFSGAGISYLNLSQQFNLEKIKSKKLFYIEEDGHWNDNGHELVFNIMTERFHASPKN